MLYKEKIDQLLESLYTKLEIIERVAAGTMPATAAQVNKTISDSKKIVEQVTDLISHER